MAPARSAPTTWPSVQSVAACSALAVALAGRGDLLFLGALLAVALADRRASAAALLGVAAVSVRWGTTSAGTITGAASTLGPGLRVGPPLAATALGLAALAVLLSGVGAPPLPRLAAGVIAGVLAGGPVGAAGAGAVMVGAGAAALGAGLSVLLSRWLAEPSDRLRTAVPVLAGAALVLAAVW